MIFLGKCLKLTLQHREAINEAFENYFQALGRALYREQAQAE
jgi:protein involved in sex pheromone biosynthesis